MKSFVFGLILLCGCLAAHSNPTNAILPDIEFVLTNAHLTIHLPQSAQIRQGRVTSIGVSDMAPIGSKFVSGAVYNDYKIYFEITIKSEQEFKHDAEFFQTDDFQEHSSLKMYDRPIGKQLRKDVRDVERNKILSISINVSKTDSQRRETGTFQEDIQRAKEMIESIKLIKMQSDETDALNPLSVIDVDRVKNEIDHLSPYMTPKDCTVALGISKREIDTSVWGRNGLTKNQGGIIPEKEIPVLEPNESNRIFMKLREGHILLLICDNRDYVISAQLDDKKWQWTK